MKPRTRRCLAIAVAFALVGVIGYAGALTAPYTGAGERFAVAHESTGAYETAVDGETDLPVVSLSDLSAGERRAYEAAKDRPIEPDTSGERVLTSIQVCDDALVVCDSYREMPHPADADRSIVEEPDGERYLVTVGTGGDVIYGSHLPVFVLIWKVAVFGPYALFLASRSLPSRSGRATNAAIGYGAFMVATALLTPYVTMYAGVGLFPWPLVAFTIVTPLVLGFEIWREWRWPSPRVIAERGLAVAIVLSSPFVLLYATGALDWALNNFFWWIVGFVTLSTAVVLGFEGLRVLSGPGPTRPVDRVRGAIEERF